MEMARRKSTIEPMYRAVGARIAELRIKRGLTQEQLASLAGLSPNYIARTEGAYHRPTLAKLLAIGHALGVSLIDLFTMADVPVDAAVLRALASALNALAKHDQRLVLQIAGRLRRSVAVDYRSR
jgi:transcriptional regulator with XRE-family HTH domain